jgi:hypothetical protein
MAGDVLGEDSATNLLIRSQHVRLLSGSEERILRFTVPAKVLFLEDGDAAAL